MELTPLALDMTAQSDSGNANSQKWSTIHRNKIQLNRRGGKGRKGIESEGIEGKGIEGEGGKGEGIELEGRKGNEGKGKEGKGRKEGIEGEGREGKGIEGEGRKGDNSVWKYRYVYVRMYIMLLSSMFLYK